MTDPASFRLRALIDRLSRLSESDDWAHGLTPTQHAALTYLAKANRFSRSPTHVATYLAATKGTVSQTLKTLVRKTLLMDHRSDTDRRSISYDLTELGQAAITLPNTLQETLAALSASDQRQLETALTGVLARHLSTQNLRRFGVCSHCRHNMTLPDGTAHCALLDVALGPKEVTQICHEFAA